MPSRKKVKADDAMLFAQIRSIPTVNGYSSFFLDGWAGTQRQLSPAADMSWYMLWAAMGHKRTFAYIDGLPSVVEDDAYGVP